MSQCQYQQHVCLDVTSSSWLVRCCCEIIYQTFRTMFLLAFSRSKLNLVFRPSMGCTSCSNQIKDNANRAEPTNRTEGGGDNGLRRKSAMTFFFQHCTYEGQHLYQSTYINWFHVVLRTECIGDAYYDRDAPMFSRSSSLDELCACRKSSKMDSRKMCA